ncbi:hypothetical protein PMAYCL1PPCAC_00453, partial [Pristionchus mayeri]
MRFIDETPPFIQILKERSLRTQCRIVQTRRRPLRMESIHTFRRLLKHSLHPNCANHFGEKSVDKEIVLRNRHKLGGVVVTADVHECLIGSEHASITEGAEENRLLLDFPNQLFEKN